MQAARQACLVGWQVRGIVCGMAWHGVASCVNLMHMKRDACKQCLSHCWCSCHAHCTETRDTAGKEDEDGGYVWKEEEEEEDKLELVMEIQT